MDFLIHYYKAAADLGDADSQFETGQRYYEGTGVNVNRDEAKKYLELAKDEYHMEAIEFLKENPM